MLKKNTPKLETAGDTITFCYIKIEKYNVKNTSLKKQREYKNKKNCI